LLLQIKFAFDLAQHLIVDASLVAGSDDGSPFGREHLLAQAQFGFLAITIQTVCGPSFLQPPRIVLGFLLVDGTQVGQLLLWDALQHGQLIKTLEDGRHDCQMSPGMLLLERSVLLQLQQADQRDKFQPRCIARMTQNVKKMNRSRCRKGAAPTSVR
jgi:hypothetical protein